MSGRNTEENNENGVHNWLENSKTGGSYDYEPLADLLKAIISGTQNTAFCHKNGIQFQRTRNKFSILYFQERPFDAIAVENNAAITQLPQ